MRVVSTVVFTVAIISNAIVLSSQFECLPNGEPIPGAPRLKPSSPAPKNNYSSEKSLSRAEPSFSAPRNTNSSGKSLPRSEPPPPAPRKNNCPEKSLPRVEPSSSAPEKNYFPEEPHSPAELLLRVRSRTPPAKAILPISSIDPAMRLPSPDGYGCGLDQMKLIRLIPFKNHRRIFELERYTFHDHQSIKIIIAKDKYGPVSNQEKIVLSTHDGDVFAMLENHNVLVGIYKNNEDKKRRVKLNMKSGTTTLLTREEVNEIPVGAQRTIMWNYRVDFINAPKNNPSKHSLEKKNKDNI